MIPPALDGVVDLGSWNELTLDRRHPPVRPGRPYVQMLSRDMKQLLPGSLPEAGAFAGSAAVSSR